MFRKKSVYGFTLIELLVVLSIIGILSLAGLGAIGNITNTVKVKADQETSRQIARNIEVMVMNGEIRNDTEKINLSNMPMSASNGSEFIAKVKFSDNNPRCLVTISDGKGFVYDIEIYHKAID